MKRLLMLLVLLLLQTPAYAISPLKEIKPTDTILTALLTFEWVNPVNVTINFHRLT